MSKGGEPLCCGGSCPFLSLQSHTSPLLTAPTPNHAERSVLVQPQGLSTSYYLGLECLCLHVLAPSLIQFAFKCHPGEAFLPWPPEALSFPFHASTESIAFSGLIIFHLSHYSICSVQAKTTFVFITISPEPRDSSAHSRCSTNSSQSNVFPLRFAFLGIPVAPCEQ